MEKKVKKKKKQFIYTFIGLVYLISYVFVMYYLFKLNILPIKLLLLVVGISLFLTFLITIVLFNKKIKKGIQSFFSVISIILIIIYSFTSYVSYKGINTLNKISFKDDLHLDNKVNTSRESFNIFISGTDEVGEVKTIGKSDSNMLISINPKTKKILMTSIPRDYYVKLVKLNDYDKLTHTSKYGLDTTIDSIEDLLDVKVNYYVRVNFTSLIEIVDAIGGITVNSEYAFTTHGMDEHFDFVKGENELDGIHALAFSRERKSFPDGDRQRIKNQQLILEAIIKKITNNPSLLIHYEDILEVLNKSMITNLSVKDLTNLVKASLPNINDWDISTISLNGINSSKLTHTYPKGYLYVMEPDRKSINDAKDKIKNTLNYK